MPLKFAELSKIERTLVSAAEDLDARIVSDRTADWLKNIDVGTEERELLRRLGEFSRNAVSLRARRLALGSLDYVRRELAADEGKRRAVLQFSRQRVESIEDNGIYWANVILTGDEEIDARALFEAAIGDVSYSTTELRKAARQFIAHHEGEAYMFGRLAADLGLLLRVLDEREYSEDQKELARAALIYFSETEDAIPDDFGLVGLLDDAFIVQQAVDQILPARANLTSYLERTVREWPFIRHLRFGLDDNRYPISDFALINSALVLDRLGNGEHSSAILVPQAGPMCYLLGLVATLAQIAQTVDTDEIPEFEPGERLMDRDAQGDVVFKNYARFDGAGFLSCDRSDATHVQLVHRARRNQSKVIQTIPIDQIGNFRRTSTGIDKRRKSKIRVDIGDRETGPLEQLFGAKRPIVLDSSSPQILVVAPIQRTREIAQKLDLFGIATADVAPTGHLRRTEDGFDVTPWSKHGAGGEPMLFVVRSVDEAYEYVLVQRESNARPIVSVIAPVRPDSADAPQLARIAADGIGVLAFVDPQDRESLEIFDQKGMSFWAWDEYWFGLLHWPHTDNSSRHPVSQYERRLRRQASSKTTVVPVAFDEISTASAQLATLNNIADSEEHPSLAEWVTQSWWLILKMCRRVVPVDGDLKKDFDDTLQALSDRAEANRFRWDEDIQSMARDTLRCIEVAVQSLGQRNPKYESLCRLVEQLPRSSILIAERDRSDLVDVLREFDVTVVSRVEEESDERVQIVPAWYGRNRMEKLVFGSSIQLQLLLYEPEEQWFKQTIRRRARAVHFANELVHSRSSIPMVRKKEEYQGSGKIPKELPGNHGDLDEFLRTALRNVVLGRNANNSSDTINARIVSFIGGMWAAFTPYHRVITVSHLFDTAALGAEEGHEVITTTVTNLRSGDIVLMLSGSDRDAIREHVAQHLAPELIDAASLWKTALRDFVQKYPDLPALRSELKFVGCRKSLATIRYWISDEYVIGPQNEAKEVPLIAQVTANVALTQNVDECVRAIRAVRSAHLTVGRALAEQVILRAREWATSGATPDELVEIEDRLVLATVDFVDPTEIELPINITNRLREATWQG